MTRRHEPRTHIFVVGNDDFNERRLSRLEQAHPWRFHRALDYEALRAPSASIRDKLAEATELIERSGHPVGGVCSYWDFPHMPMASLLAERFGRPAPRLESIVRCQHKYYSRVEQAKVIPENVPRFVLVDPERHRLDDLGLDPPFWLKPVRASASHLGFLIEDRAGFEKALETIRKRIGSLATATNEILRMSRLPEELAHIHGGWCLAEELISDESTHQCTAEGYVYDGEPPVIYGIVDSLTYPGVSSFWKYRYPSMLPKQVRARIETACIRLVEHLGYRDGAFNVEFFWNERTDRLMLLEINPRISQSHADLFSWVDGVSNIERVVSLCLGERPRQAPARRDRGEHTMAVAAKCFYRAFRDARVLRCPSKAEVEAIERSLEGVKIQIPPRGRTWLSDMPQQDSYSYELALIHIGAGSDEQIDKKYRKVIERLTFELEDLEKGRPFDPREDPPITIQEAR